MKTPFYIIRRTPVNKETALSLAWDLHNGDGTLASDFSTLIDFCLSGGTDEKVFIEPGMRVRIKSMPAGAFDYTRPGVGVECKIAEVSFYADHTSFALNTDEAYTDEAYNCLRINVDNPDLSEYLELI